MQSIQDKLRKAVPFNPLMDIFKNVPTLQLGEPIVSDLHSTGIIDVDAYKAHLRGLSDSALREETIAAVTEANALRMEACRQQWETLGRASVFLECYNKAVDNMTHI